MVVSILTGDCREVLATLPAESVQCVVTSPPYFGLRDYGTATWEGGDPACPHRVGGQVQDRKAPGAIQTGVRPGVDASRCKNCGAIRIDSQIGLEPTPDAYVAEMVAVFREVRRVLRADGTCWLNLGDSYASATKGSGGATAKQATNAGAFYEPRKFNHDVKEKDLIGIPWRVAFALQADGWVLRQEIIWAKPNPMPESVTDRCTKAHEQVFLFSKASWSGPENRRFAGISSEDARWLALCIDTEGCIVIKRTKHEGRGDTFAPQVSFGSTSRALMERFVEIVGHGNLAQRDGRNAPMWYWQVTNGIASDFLRCVYPHLIIKQRQARVGIHVDSLTYYRGGKTLARKQRSEAETAALVSLWARNKELNRFGSPDISDVPEPKFGRWTGGPRYYFDAKAIAEPFADERMEWNTDKSRTTRNRRSVWPIATQPFSGSHFATMPPELAETCIKAGTSERGQCPHCGAPWVRQTSRGAVQPTVAASELDRYGTGDAGIHRKVGGQYQKWLDANPLKTTGWLPTCSCPDHQPIPQVVLDPFGGAGTTALVADRLQRDATLVELNPAYAAMARERINGEAGMFAPAAE